MAAKGEQIPAPAAVAAPIDTPKPAPDCQADGAPLIDGGTPRESPAPAGVEAGGRTAGCEGQGGDPRGDCQVPVVLRQDDGLTAVDEKAGGEKGEEEEEAGDAWRGGGKRCDRRGGLFLPDAKRHKPCPAALEKLPTPPAEADRVEDVPSAEAEGTGKRGDAAPGGGEASPFSYSFSFDTRGFPAQPIETTPKFGSFNFAGLSSAESGAEQLGPPPPPAGGRDEGRGPYADSAEG